MLSKVWGAGCMRSEWAMPGCIVPDWGAAMPIPCADAAKGTTFSISVVRIIMTKRTMTKS